MTKKFQLLFLSFILAFGTFISGCTEEPLLPSVITGDASNVNSYSALISGSVTSTGGTALVAKGVCWSTSASPSVDGLHSDNGITLGDFTSAISNLNPNTTYYVRAYATNLEGTGYGQQITFKTATK